MATQSFHPFRSEQAKAEYEAVYAERAKAWPVPFENLLTDTVNDSRTVTRSVPPSPVETLWSDHEGGAGR